MINVVVTHHFIDTYRKQMHAEINSGLTWHCCILGNQKIFYGDGFGDGHGNGPGNRRIADPELAYRSTLSL